MDLPVAKLEIKIMPAVALGDAAVVPASAFTALRAE